LSDEERKKSSNINVRTVIAAAVAGALATALISSFGLAGSLIGGALSPVIVLFGRELVFLTADKVPPPPLPTRAPRLERLPGESADAPRADVPKAPSRWRRRLRRVRWGRILAAGLAAGAIVVAVFTLPELIIGESLVTDRRTTFFSDSPSDGGTTQTAPATTTETEAAPTTVEPSTETVPAPETPTTTEGVTPTETVPAAPAPEPAPQAVPPPEEVAPPPEATPTDGALPPPQETPLP